MTLTEIVDRMVHRMEVRGPDKELVSELSQELVEHIIATLKRGEDVKIRGLGRFHWVYSKPRYVRFRGQKYLVPGTNHLKFKPAKRLRRHDMPEEKEMTKLGVVLDDDKVKEATIGGGDPTVPAIQTCSKCHRKLDDAGVCPEHGTEPLEKRTY